MIIIELKNWNGNNEFGGNTSFFYASFKDLKELKIFIDDKKKPIFTKVFGNDYHERITGIIYVCGYDDYIESDVAEEIYKDYIERIFS